ncbi:unnamed protein product [Candidula unifasciata]|uniref:4-hydroxybenzoate polyprenyltransferase, mitochondrial n=1 Tax=Candidula unifasciata TaxID=100452 RepID=A0A8S3ZB63_9EUPU|nr:unnamed protein product [Candidula unifasciata]
MFELPALNCRFQMMSRHLKQLSGAAPYVFRRCFSTTLPPLAGYHHITASFLSSSQGGAKTANCSSDKHLLSHQNVLYRYKSQQGFSSFSPAKLILEASPASLQPYLRLIRFDKPIGTWLLYWPCTWSIALAAQPGCLPDLKMLALFGAGAFFMRGAGCIINDMWDKDYDSKVARTKTRPLAAGEITQFQALVCLSTQLSCALAVLLQLNTYSIILGAASLGIVIVYPLFKRITYWPQIILGFAFNYGALLGWSAVTGSVDWLVCLPLYCSSIMWTLVYDTIYAHQDKTDDMIVGVKSAAIFLGDRTKPCLSVFAAGMTGGLALTGYLCHMPWPYYLVVGGAAARIAYQLYTVDLNNPDDCGGAFRAQFYLGALVFAGIVVANLMRSPEQRESGQDGSPAVQLQSGQDGSPAEQLQ